jgi:hypothetical protein
MKQKEKNYKNAYQNSSKWKHYCIRITGSVIDYKIVNNTLISSPILIRIGLLLILIGRKCTILKEIRNLGIHISVDDFGTGYSSLSYLKELPIDTLKVDQSFVKDIHTNKESKEIAKAIIN